MQAVCQWQSLQTLALGERRRAPAIRHVDHVGASHHFEQFAVQMRPAPDACRRHADLARIGFLSTRVNKPENDDPSIVADNLPVHKAPVVRKMIEAAGTTLLYLPPSSPDLNPIEQAFSKLKAHLRKAAETTVPGLLRRIGRVLTTFSPQECRNFLRHAGYVRT
jgi:transposase